MTHSLTVTLPDHVKAQRLSSRDRHQTGVGNLPLADWAHLRGEYGDDANGLTVQRYELDLVPRAMAMDQHNGANVASSQSTFREVCCKNHTIKLFDHDQPLANG